MSTKTKFRMALIQAGAAVVLLGGLAGAATATGAVPGLGSDRRPTVVRTDDDGPGDFSGPSHDQYGDDQYGDDYDDDDGEGDGSGHDDDGGGRGRGRGGDDD